MKISFLTIVKNRNAVMLLGIVLGLVWDGAARWTSGATLPALAIIMTISTLGVTGASLRSTRHILKPALAGILMSYALHATVLLLLARFLIDDTDLWTGFVVLAAVPPAVAVIPFSFFLGGDNEYALIGTVGGYVGALAIQPLIVVALLGAGFVSPWKLIITLLELIAGPLILSRILIRTGAAARIEFLKGPLTNWSFFILTYTMVGLNRGLFLSDPLGLLPVTAIAVLSTFVLGSIIKVVARTMGVPGPRATSLLLLGTFKNFGLAGGLALFFFNETAVVPATVTSVVAILYVVWLEAKKGWGPGRSAA